MKAKWLNVKSIKLFVFVHCRLQLACLHFNENCGRSKTGQRVVYPKANGYKAVVRTSYEDVTFSMS